MSPENEAERRGELLHVVPQRHIRGQLASAQERPHELGEDQVDVLDAVRLVDYHVLDRGFVERRNALKSQ